MLGLSLFIITSSAQIVTIQKVELAGEKILVFYDLDDSNPNNEYKLELYSSVDNYVAPLTKVKGDVGPEVKPGAGRKIEWSTREELGGYKGKLALEIRGKVYIPFVKLQNFDPQKSYKRGKSYSINWKPGNTNPINLELFKGGQRIDGAMSIPNNGGHTIYIPSHARKGSDYRLKVSDTKNSDDVLYSSEFQVKPKVPLAVKILPMVAIGGAAALLGGGDSKEADDSIPGVPPLPTGN
jgi:hypothetical protein